MYLLQKMRLQVQTTTLHTTPFGGTGNTGPGTYPYGANKKIYFAGNN